MKTRILTVFREQESSELIRRTLGDECEVVSVNAGAAAIERVQSGDTMVVVCGDTLTDMTGEELALGIRAVRPGVRVIIVAERAKIENALSVLGPGEFIYLEKPLTPSRLRHAVTVEVANARVVAENWTLRARVDGMDPMGVLIGSSMAADSVRERIRYAGVSGANVLVTGASGTGKHLAAEAVHRAGKHGATAIVRVDCSTTPEETLARELFGAERPGGGVERRSGRGKVVLAEGSTLLIVEVGDMAPGVQARLVDALGRAQDVRVIATTRHDLRERARTGEFREDLYYMINVLGVEMPTLHERRADIPALASHFVRYLAARDAAAPIEFTQAALERLMEAPWPGNVRELHNVIERTMLITGGGRVDAADLRMNARADAATRMAEIEGVFRTGTIREMEKLMILNRLKELDDNRTRSAESLEISVRTLRNKLNEYNVTRRVVVRASDPALA